MYILGLDFETTGLNPETDRIIEVGAILWDVERKFPVYVLSSFIFGPSVPEEITKITRITNHDVVFFGKPEAAILDELCGLMSKADAVVAHNGNKFDKAFFESTLKANGKSVPNNTWVDTITDVPYPDHMTSRNLTYLCAMHGFLNNGAHRAYSDVEAMLRVLSHYDIPSIIEQAKVPTIEIEALVSYATNNLAKALKYRWRPETKQWIKQIKENTYQEEHAKAEASGFLVRILKPKPTAVPTVMQMDIDSPF